jgi:hypothetical protein
VLKQFLASIGLSLKSIKLESVAGWLPVGRGLVLSICGVLFNFDAIDKILIPGPAFVNQKEQIDPSDNLLDKTSIPVYTLRNKS